MYKRHSGPAQWLSLAVLFLFAAINAEAATFSVTKTSDTGDGVCDADCSLREAVAAANASPGEDAIYFISPLFNTPQTISLTGGEMVVSPAGGPITINGAGIDLLTISGSHSSRIFYVAPEAVLNLNNLMLTAANGHGTVFDGYGGAILIYAGTLTLDNCILDGNSAAVYGGAIYDFFRSHLSIHSTRLTKNYAQDGGALMSKGDTKVSITDSIFIENKATGGGGGAYFFDGEVTIAGTTFETNEAASGGGIYAVEGSLSIDDSGFFKNTAYTDSGGAINGRAVIANSTIADNYAGQDGGGIKGSGEISGSFIEKNTAGVVGGGIAGTSPQLNVRGTTIRHNTAAAGGGIYMIGGSVSTSSVTHNTASDIGGGAFTLQTSTFTNSTISGNRSLKQGGGIDNRGALALSCVTLVDNEAASGAGVFNLGTANVRNTILANNATLIFTQEDFWGLMNSQGHNLIESGLNTTFTGDTTTNIVGHDPLLYPISDGPAPAFHALMPNSPAADKGSSGGLTTDQRGSARPFDLPAIANAANGDGADIGAIEYRTGDAFGYESDIASRPSGDGAVQADDVIVIRHLVVGSVTAGLLTNEFQRADSAPAGGDGVLAASDVIQARRYAAGLDPLTGARGPFGPAAARSDDLSLITAGDVDVTLRAASDEAKGGRHTVEYIVELGGNSAVHALGFTLEFDARGLANPRVSAASGALGVLTVNASDGRLGVLIDSARPLADAFTGSTILRITFDLTERRLAEPVRFAGSLAVQEAADAAGRPVRARWHVEGR